MLAAFAMDDGLGRSRWFAAKPDIFPFAVFAAPKCFRSVELAGAFSDRAQAIDAGLDGHLAATLDGVDLFTERIQASALARIGKHPQLISAASWRDR